jgi:hypothetical protein
LPGLKIMDETLVTAKESLVAEWLFSLGRGRQFKIGQHDELMAYLISIRPDVGCVANGSQSDVESQGKLDKILNLARQNHCDLQLAVSATSSPTPTRRSVPSTSPAVKKTVPLRKQVSPPKDGAGCSVKTSKGVSAASNKSYTYEDDLSLEPMPALMYQSLDPSSLERSSSATLVPPSRPARPVSAQHYGLDDDDDLPGQTTLRRAASAAQQTRKPLYNRSVSQQNRSVNKPVSKLPTRKSGVERSGSSSSTAIAPAVKSTTSKLSETQAAVAIQKVWRGYQTRNLDPAVVRLKNHMRLSRAEEHVEHLMSRQLAVTRSARELPPPSVSNGLTAKPRSSRSTESADDELARLRQSHEMLERQVNDLQQSMQQVLDWMSLSTIQQPVPRPRTLPLTCKSAPSVQQPLETFAQGMADRLIQSVSDSSILEPTQPPSNNNNNMSTSSSSSTVVGLVNVPRN